MIRKLGVLYVVVLFCCIPQPLQLPPEPSPEIINSHVMVGTIDKNNENFYYIKTYGSGVIIGNDKSRTYILTAKHVQDYPRNSTCKLGVWIYPSRKVIPAKTVVEDKTLDAAIISIARVDNQPVKISMDNPLIGQEVFVFGNPDLYSLKILKRNILFYTNVNRVILDGSTIPGFSGGGMFGSKNRLLGICYSRFSKGWKNGVCIPIRSLSNLINSYPKK
jgi:S1-C subfamily serine protease